MTSIRKIFNGMVKRGEELGDKILTPAEVTKHFRVLIGSNDIKVKTHRSSAVDMDQIVIGGRYDPDEDEENFASINIFIAFNPNQKTIAANVIDWKSVCVELLECAGHEVVHQEQYRRRDFDARPSLFVSRAMDPHLRNEQEYLGNLDEIEAYGYSIAVESYLRHRAKELTSKHVRESSIFNTYADTFGIQHPIVKQLLDYAWKFYGQLQGDSNVKKSKQYS